MAKMNDRVPKERLSTSRLNHVFLKIYPNDPTDCDSPLQIKCENFIMGCTVGFRAILDQRLAFTTLDENQLNYACPLFKRALM